MAGIGNFRREIYTVGWLCALPTELAAARKMLDDQHGCISLDGTYTLGRIGKLNVVIACLPKGYIGTISAATVFTSMKTEFRAIKHWLLVGVGGGVPNPKDVRLGDVVVSCPTGRYSGVVQYDSGKSYPGGRFERTGCLNSPSKTLLSAVATLEANWFSEESKFLENASRLDDLPKFTREGAGPDYLFGADYHREEVDFFKEASVTCGASGICSEHKIVARKPREHENKVIVHYGTIASGGLVIKDAKTRDRISTRFGPDGVLCFEMEAAGLMNDLQCLVIRGICDYADSHKNKLWQPYAAKMAAAYARELVNLLSTEEVVGGVLEGRVTSTPKSLVSRFTTSRTIRTIPTTALNPTGLSLDIASTNTKLKFDGEVCLSLDSQGLNIVVSNPTTPNTGGSNPEVSNKPKYKRRRYEEVDSYRSNKKDGTFCFHCGLPGVIAPNCVRCRDRCLKCGEEGHWVEDKKCRLGPKSSESRRPTYEEHFSRNWSRPHHWNYSRYYESL
ncbi:hypothetical protein TWF970_010454 [Orbilia oligospora]|uniref:Uncharacterized protein n=1 Tax=Orbilia oligospora TaxID=2813651 RepID=A0A7C8RJ48_ORBOL|nr:hypothetical protein TWF970_010454 [Orbilia oligospora]